MAPAVTRSNSGKSEGLVAEEYARRRKAVDELRKERQIKKRIMRMSSNKPAEDESSKEEKKKYSPIMERTLKLHEEARGYLCQVSESQGFDVDRHLVPDSYQWRTVVPLTPDELLDDCYPITPLCNAAIDLYNTIITSKRKKKKNKKKNDADADADADDELEFHKVAYATYERLPGPCSGNYYLTFYATPKYNHHHHLDANNNDDDDDQLLKSKSSSSSHLLLQAKVYHRQLSKFGDAITTVEFCRIKAPPSVQYVYVAGDAVVGNVIRGGGHYVGGQQGPSIFEWFRLDPHTRERVLVLTGSTKYHLTKEDVGHHLVFKYTPVNSLGQEGKPKSRWSLLVWREKNVPLEAEMFSNNELR